MSTRNVIERALNGALMRFGYQLMPNRSNTSLRAAFSRLAQRPVAIQTVIDVGASDGRWSEKIYAFYPDAFYLLIEANGVHEAGLKQFKKKHASADYLLKAAGEHVGEVFFDLRAPLSGAASVTPAEGYIRVPVTTIDAQVAQRQLKPPFLIKLDTHGFEVPILNGAQETLKQTSLLVIETYNFQLRPDSLRFHEMCSWMEARGFRPIDVVEPFHRERDQALWQFDLVFIRADRPEFQTNSYI